MLVRDVADGCTRREAAHGAGVSDAKPLVAAPVHELRDALRYFGEARDRSMMPIAAVTSCWIAMERLGKATRAPGGAANTTVGSPGKIGAFLPKRLGSVMGLAAARSVWTGSWHLAQAAGRSPDLAEDWSKIEAHLGATNSFVDLKKWAVLLCGLGTSKAEKEQHELLGQLRARFPAVIRVRLLVAEDLLTDSQSMVDWLNPIIAISHAHVDRLQLLRHRAVHEALSDVAGAREMRDVGLYTLDAIFQVIPLWLGHPDVGGHPWKAIDKADRWRRTLLSSWGRSKPAQTEPAKVLRA